MGSQERRRRAIQSTLPLLLTFFLCSTLAVFPQVSGNINEC